MNSTALLILFFLLSIVAIVVPLTISNINNNPAVQPLPTVTCTSCNNNTCANGGIPVCGVGASVIGNIPILNNITTSEVIGSTILVSGGNTITTKGELRFEDAASTNYVGFKAPTTVTLSTVWSLPVSDGTLGQSLQTDGAGNLIWGSSNVATLTLYVSNTGNDSNSGSLAAPKLTLKGALDAIPPVVGSQVIVEILTNINLGTTSPSAYQMKALTSGSSDTVDILIRGTGNPSIDSGSATSNDVLENTQANLNVTFQDLTFSNGAATLRWYAGKLTLSGTITVNGWDSAITVSDSGVLNTVAGSTITINGGNNGSASVGIRADLGGYAQFSNSTVNFGYYAGVVVPTPKVLLAVEAKRFGNVLFDTCVVSFTDFQLGLTTNPDKARLQVIGGSVTFNCDADVIRLINVSKYSHYASSGATDYIINNLNVATVRPILLVGFMQLSGAYTATFNAPYVGFETNFIILSEFGYLLDEHPSRTDPYTPYFAGVIARNQIRGALLNGSGNDNRLVRKQSLIINAGVPFVLQEGFIPFNVQFIPESIKVFEQVGGGPGFTLIAHGGAYTPPYNLTFALGPVPTITVNSMISSGAICFVEYIPNTFNVGAFETQELYYS